MNALIGLHGVGKTTLLNELNKKGFKTFNCDEWVREFYIKQGIDRKELKKEWFNKSDKERNDFLISIHQPLYDYLMNNKFDYVEIPILETSPIDFTNLFDKVFLITRDIEIEKFYKDLAKPIRQIPKIKIKLEDDIENIIIKITQ